MRPKTIRAKASRYALAYCTPCTANLSGKSGNVAFLQFRGPRQSGLSRVEELRSSAVAPGEWQPQRWNVVGQELPPSAALTTARGVPGRANLTGPLAVVATDPAAGTAAEAACPHDPPGREADRPAPDVGGDAAGAAASAAGRQRYQIRVSGRLDQTIRPAFPGLRARFEGGDTVLTGVVADQAALYGVRAEAEALGLELIEVPRLPPRDEPRETSP